MPWLGILACFHMKTITDRVITFCSCVGSQFDSETRFLQPKLAQVGHVGFAQQVVIPAMKKQGSTTLLLWQPFGIGSQVDGLSGKTIPQKFIELDARRLCNDNPLTKNVANIRDMNKALDLYHAAGITVGMYLGSPREPRWNGCDNLFMDKVVSAVVTPFKYSVDFWALDELSESTGRDRLHQVAASVEHYTGSPCLGETRPLRGKALPVHGAFVESGKWKSSKKELGDRFHLGLHELPSNYPVYVIEGNETVDEARAILDTGARFAIGVWSKKTVSQLTRAATS